LSAITIIWFAFWVSIFILTILDAILETFLGSNAIFPNGSLIEFAFEIIYLIVDGFLAIIRIAQGLFFSTEPGGNPTIQLDFLFQFIGVLIATIYTNAVEIFLDYIFYFPRLLIMFLQAPLSLVLGSDLIWSAELDAVGVWQIMAEIDFKTFTFLIESDLNATIFDAGLVGHFGTGVDVLGDKPLSFFLDLEIAVPVLAFYAPFSLEFGLYQLLHDPIQRLLDDHGSAEDLFNYFISVLGGSS
jgi:hypothetical protein